MTVHTGALGSSRADQSSSWTRSQVATMLSRAGITLDGDMPWDPHIVRPRALRRVLFGGALGAGDAYVDGDWECEALDEFFARLLRSNADGSIRWRVPSLAGEVVGRLLNGQTPERSQSDISSHYDLGSDLYRAMLGRTMAYSCGYWRHAASLDEAQDAKHELICQKIGLQTGMRVLDIGCGWGAFARYASLNYGVEVVGITLSAPQAEWATHATAGLPVEIRRQDYRDVDGRFDRVVSIGMLEHVGPGNYRTYFEHVADRLTPTGLFLLHTIGGIPSVRSGDPWINRYIFPHAVLPSCAQLTNAFEGLFVLEDWHNFGLDYDRTLMAWHSNVEAAWPTLPDYSETFRRLWRYYLLSCAGMFRARRNQLWQLVLSPHGVPGGYRRVGC